jgi:hypothetical protein
LVIVFTLVLLHSLLNNCREDIFSGYALKINITINGLVFIAKVFFNNNKFKENWSFIKN